MWKLFKTETDKEIDSYKKEIEHKQNRIDFYQKKLGELLTLSYEVERSDIGNVVALEFKGHMLPVDIRYLQDILAYSEGVCKQVIINYENEIRSLEAKLKNIKSETKE